MLSIVNYKVGGIQLQHILFCDIRSLFETNFWHLILFLSFCLSYVIVRRFGPAMQVPAVGIFVDQRK